MSSLRNGGKNYTTCAALARRIGLPARLHLCRAVQDSGGLGEGTEAEENRLERIRVLGVLRALTPDTATYKKAKVLSRLHTPAFRRRNVAARRKIDLVARARRRMR